MVTCCHASGCVPYQPAISRDDHEISECSQLGYPPNTKDFADCRLKIRSIDAQNEATQSQRELSDTIEASRGANYDPDMKCKVTHHGNTLCQNY